MFLIAQSVINDPDDLRFMERLCDDYKELMYRTARSLTRDAMLQDDIVQESLVRLIDKIPLLRELEPPQLIRYISITVKHTAINELKKSKIRLKYYGPLPEEDLADPAPLEELHQILFYKHRLNSIWKKLSHSERFLLEGAYLLGYTSVELGDLLKRTPARVRSDLTRARHHATKLIKEQEKKQHDKKRKTTRRL